MQIELSVDDGPEINIPISLGDGDKVHHLIERIETQAGTDGASIMSIALDSNDALDPSIPTHTLHLLHTKIRIRRACIDVHFESECARHYFPVNAPWSRVHRWACRHFQVAHDACACLELRLGSPTGPPLNERKEIGSDPSCRTVWVVKPGPEQNGGSNVPRR